MFTPEHIEWVPFNADIVAVVDGLVAKAKKYGVKGHVEHPKHWEIVEDIFRAWAIMYPLDYKSFVHQQKGLKSSQANQYGSKREKGGAEVQHIMEIPKTLAKMLRAVFYTEHTDPTTGAVSVSTIDEQFMDKRFAMEFTKRLPITKIADKI